MASIWNRIGSSIRSGVSSVVRFITGGPEEEPEEELEEEPIGGGIIRRPPPEEPGAPPWEEEVTLTDDYGNYVETDELMTFEKWMDETRMPREYLLNKYGIDNIDIIEQLIDQGYDYDIYGYNRKGQLVRKSGLWRDFREAYAAEMVRI